MGRALDAIVQDRRPGISTLDAALDGLDRLASSGSERAPAFDQLFSLVQLYVAEQNGTLPPALVEPARSANASAPGLLKRAKAGKQRVGTQREAKARTVY